MKKNQPKKKKTWLRLLQVNRRKKNQRNKSQLSKRKNLKTFQLRFQPNSDPPQQLCYYPYIVQLKYEVASIINILNNFLRSGPVKVDLQIVDGIFLTTQQKHNLVIDEFKLPRHFLINIVYFVHGSDCPVHCLKVRQVFVECILHFTLLLPGQG